MECENVEDEKKVKALSLDGIRQLLLSRVKRSRHVYDSDDMHLRPLASSRKNSRKCNEKIS